jgi:hypothetical protein
MLKSKIAHLLITALFIQLLTSCNSNTHFGPEPEGVTTGHDSVNSGGETFSLSNWKVTDNSMGPITIGSAYAEVHQFLLPFEIKKVSSYKLGYDGPEAYIDVYYWNGAPAFWLELDNESSSILEIRIIHKKLTTHFGIGTGSTVSEILKICPDAQFYQNTIDSGEYAQCYEMGITFAFNDRVCQYDESDEGGQGTPVNLGVRPIYMIIGGVINYGC